ncbi:MAG: hypothetical protein Q8O75_01120 [bacterium]|nr:hypothetical protein [bacterium]
MPHLKCPIETCSLVFAGSLSDIAPQALSHLEGSHQVIDLIWDDIARMIEQQASGEEVILASPKVEEKKPVPAKEVKPRRGDDWWKK